MLYRKGGRNRERNCRIPRKSPPPTFCTKAKVAKGGAYLRDTTVFQNGSFPTTKNTLVHLFCLVEGIPAKR